MFVYMPYCRQLTIRSEQGWWEGRAQKSEESEEEFIQKKILEMILQLIEWIVCDLPLMSETCSSQGWKCIKKFHSEFGDSQKLHKIYRY